MLNTGITTSFALRAGYFYENKDKVTVAISQPVLVLNTTSSVSISLTLFPQSGVNHNPLSNTLRFSVLFDFGGQKEINH